MPRIVFAAILALFFALPPLAASACDSDFVNPVTEIAWRGMFPIRMFGQIVSEDGPYPTQMVRAPMCTCEDGSTKRFGIVAGARVPEKMFDVTKHSFCMVGLGVELEGSDIWGDGTSREEVDGNQAEYFAQTHMYFYNPLVILELFVDMPCFDKSPLTIAQLSEFNYFHSRPLEGAILSPESLIFSSLPVIMAGQLPESAAVNTLGANVDSLFWATGWGGSYSMSGYSTNGNTQRAEASAHVAAKSIYQQHRMLIMHGTQGEGALCGPFFQPVWSKSQYTMQVLRPVRGNVTFPVGRSSIFWGAGKNPGEAGKADDWAYLLYVNRDCCTW